MSLDILFENLSNPALLFFLLGIVAVQVKSDLFIPETTSKFISLYLLFSIGFKGGQELAHSHFQTEMLWTILFGISSAVVVPIYAFFVLRKKLGVDNAGAIAAAFGSISAVTFVTGVSYLEMREIEFGGYMIALMALMEAPAIIIGLLLISLYRDSGDADHPSILHSVKHSITNGSVLLILGSLAIGFIASEKQAAGIAPFTTDIFKGFLAFFLLDMGIISGKKLSELRKHGLFPFAFSIALPLFNGITTAYLSGFITGSEGDRLLLSILVASASYIAVPASMKLAVPKANPGLYVPMALAITFPFNIAIGMPIYLSVIKG
ncbi:MAG: sodium-dependent bicarbonate transport family permease [Bacteroidetes bacterium]|uniref:Sodium-dependent bicarbonate transport family permease n=1 Tax=Phaeocystidibacter marisrubri TaxID=1577780 RepID=A0A6L3ZCE4_9FLAO|nr:sodium-dependent bicarbonate transport family permease [Phaeocystidibacter marisrubri]KAB2815521.1 sodium-dependent bicarbonate transport family permease [Phaeocystidibacter marisrubri]TNE30485.1 MAG: sodium-dependent bicarbonate transport family permease [Bacteroidota bacterium]GGH64327.1 sodium-dependent bicarbonate transport family permease [Phaeocystidibacter marisrubri]